MERYVKRDTSPAALYDDQCRQMEWHGYEALFGMMYEYLQPGQTVLDLGIGTGLDAALYHKAGLKVYGVDASQDMLNVCEKKMLAEELRSFDIRQPDWPYQDESFDHVTACGVFHFIRDLDCVFDEVRRLLKTGGCFGFTVKGVIDGKTEYTDTGSGISIYCQGDAYIEGLAVRHKFVLLKQMVYWTYNDLKKTERSFFTLYVMRNSSRYLSKPL
jgi:ubiquinone/menaquinone biosynthesis C-methylase UbiE